MFLVFEYTLRPEAVKNDHILFAYARPYSVTDIELANVQLEQTLAKNDPSVYFHKEVLINSMEGNAMHLITITRQENWQQLDANPESNRDTIPEVIIEPKPAESTEETETVESEIQEVVEESKQETENPIDYLYPNKDEKRPLHFVGKPVIFLSARVHCGETPANFFL